MELLVGSEIAGIALELLLNRRSFSMDPSIMGLEAMFPMSRERTLSTEMFTFFRVQAVNVFPKTAFVKESPGTHRAGNLPRPVWVMT